jgi:hypothetical protein
MNVPGPFGGRRLVLAVVCLVAVVAGVQLLDPFESGVGPEPVGDPPTAPTPAEAVRYSMATLDASDHALTVTLNQAGERLRYWRGTVNYSQRRAYVKVGPTDRVRAFYVHADGAWTKPPNGEWRHYGLFDRRNRFERSTMPTVFRPSAVAADRTRVHNRTGDTLWVRVDGGETTAIPRDGPADGHVLYELDAETYHLRRAVERSPEGDVRAVYVVEGYGETRVERPPETRSLAVNLLSDLLR